MALVDLTDFKTFPLDAWRPAKSYRRIKSLISVLRILLAEEQTTAEIIEKSRFAPTEASQKKTVNSYENSDPYVGKKIIYGNIVFPI